MSLRSSGLKIADKLRGYGSKSSVDMFTTSVTIRTRTWTGGLIGKTDDGYTDVDVLITPRPKVRDLSQREITNSGGRYQAGDVRVGPITPQYSGGGYTEAQLAPTGSRAIEILYVLSGGMNGDYIRIDCQTDRALSYFLTLRRKRSSP